MAAEQRHEASLQQLRARKEEILRLQITDLRAQLQLATSAAPAHPPHSAPQPSASITAAISPPSLNQASISLIHSSVPSSLSSSLPAAPATVSLPSQLSAEDLLRLVRTISASVPAPTPSPAPTMQQQAQIVLAQSGPNGLPISVLQAFMNQLANHRQQSVAPMEQAHQRKDPTTPSPHLFLGGSPSTAMDTSSSMTAKPSSSCGAQARPSTSQLPQTDLNLGYACLPCSFALLNPFSFVFMTILLHFKAVMKTNCLFSLHPG